MKAKIYTKSGDKGQTSLVGGARVAKTHPRLEAYGTLDELNSVLGILNAQLADSSLGKFGIATSISIRQIQNCLFNIGSHLACEDEKIRKSLPNLNSERLKALEDNMDSWEAELPELRNFILPGGSLPATYTHLARTICRRAERLCVGLGQEANAEHVIYLNRLSDWLFVLARQINHTLNVQDIQWSKD